MTERVPARVEAVIKADLRPVRPLPPPERRVLRLAPIAALTLIAASSVFAFRSDAAALGWILTWAVSIAQTVFALALIALALRDAVPGRTIDRSAVLLAGGSVLAFSLAATMRTWALSPTMIRPGMAAWVGTICFTGTIVTAFPVLAGAAALAARAFAVSPWSSGALYGLGAGLAADAGWRLFCHYSDPLHVLSTHTGGVLATMVMGMAAAVIAARRARS